MNAARLILSLAMLAAAWPSLLLAADAPPELSHNPFSRPSSEFIPVAREVVDEGEKAPETLPLLATMVGQVNRLANVGGRILKPGDDYQGYRLLRIHEDSVVFERRGENITVYVRTPVTEDRAERRSRNSER
jgi:hypothetical protein